MVKKYDLEDRLVEFAVNAALLCKGIPNDMIGLYYANQLLRSGGSSALNFGEAQGTNSNRDYVNKAGITLKELKESRVNLKILKKLDYVDSNKCSLLLDEVEQFIKIIATIIKNKK
jgi:four helix bundle protein